ncbi:ankyrin repeat domain-containing protein [candidate division KSB1 bacterium]|nr:ankyrin repeat domain-containing protein [candidate division KSB1 bacterium]
MSDLASEKKILKQLLQTVSDVLFPDQLGEKTVEINSRDSDGDTPLHILIRRNDVHGVEVLISAGANVNAAGDMGEMPLHVAITMRNLEIIQLLLSAGADVNIACEFGDTPKQRASKQGMEISRLFE